MAFLELLQQHQSLLLSMTVILGLLVGSFLNVLIYRLPLMMQREWRVQCIEFLQVDERKIKAPVPAAEHRIFNLVKPDSHCPHCRKPVRPWENIPVISYLLLRGRCSGCSQRISPRYPVIELVTGLLSGIVAWQYGATWLTLALLFFTWSLIALTMIDFDHQLLPDSITLFLLWLGLLLNTAGTGMGVSAGDAVLGAIGGYMALWLVYQGFKLLTGKEGMGHGDFKLLAALGAWMGWQSLLLIIILSSLVGAVVGIFLLVALGRDRNVPIPFGPYLAGAGMIVMLWGEQLQRLYFDRLVN
jgi:leader peptidase (prepilin peptidase) / N-methyltransferase